jgi:ribosomal protein S12 methylthiotransferase accessory factor
MKLTAAPKDRQTYKCDSPEHTVQKLEEALGRLGLEFQYTGCVASRSGELHWGNLRIPSLNYFVEGKGTSALLARASAYAEMAERISAGHAVKPDFIKKFDHSDVFPELYGYSNFDFLQGYVNAAQSEVENPLTVKTLLVNRNELSEKDIEKITTSEIAKHWADGYSLLQDRTVNVPVKLVHKINGTNGLAAGNSIEEAVVQAANEIFERYVCIETVKKGKPVPTVNRNTIDDPQINALFRLFEKNGIDITVKDFSRGGLFPCLGILMKNKSASQDKNPIKRAFRTRSLRVASSHHAKEALLRCFTEKMQGKTADQLKKEKYFDLLWAHFVQHFFPDYEPPVFFYNLLRKYEYAGDLSFLEDGKTVPFRKEEPSYDCMAEIERIREICKTLNTDCVIVDLTHPVIQFPVVRVIIPGLSDVLSYTRPKRTDPLAHQIIEPTRAEKDFELQDEKYIYHSEWLENEKELKNLAREILDYIKSYNTIFLYTYGLSYRRIDAVKLLSCIFVKLDDMEGFQACVKMLSVMYPDQKRLFKTLQLHAVTNKKEKLLQELRNMEGCERFLISDPLQNPLTSFRDETCPPEREEKYLKDLRKLVGSFYHLAETK